MSTKQTKINKQLKHVHVEYYILTIANIGRNWMKLGRNPIELVVPERLGGVRGPNLDRNGPKMLK